MEHVVRNGRAISFGLSAPGDAQLAPVSERIAVKIVSVVVGTLTIGVLGTIVGAGISFLDAKKLKPATVGQGAMVGAAIGATMGLLTDVSVRTVKTADSKNGAST